MTDYQQRKLEMRRMRDEIERKRAQRQQAIADWARIITGFAIIIAAIVAGYLIIRDGERRADEEMRRTEAIREMRKLNEEAIDRLSKNPNDGAAWLAFMVGTAILYGGEK